MLKNTGVERAKTSQYDWHPGRLSNNNTEEPKQVLETGGTRIECSIEELGEIELVRVHNWRDGNYSNWKTMIEQYHYLGHGKLYGKQIRYLIRKREFWVDRSISIQFSGVAIEGERGLDRVE